MFASYGDVLETHSYTELCANPAYAPYVTAMDHSINRAMWYAQVHGAIPPATHPLASPIVEGNRAVFALDDIPDLERVEGVMLVTPTQYAACPYVWEGGTTLVVPLYRAGEYVLRYTRRLTPVDGLTEESVELPLPDAVAALIPYYVKSDLYEEEDAASAKAAGDIFRQGVAAFVAQGEGVQPLRQVYNWEDL